VSFPGRQITTYASQQPFLFTRPTQQAVPDRLSLTANLSGDPTADIQVTYTGFTNAAKAAFEAAVIVWEHTLVSSQPIRVNANWAPLGAGILGSAGPNGFYLGADNMVYPAALAESVCNCALNSSSPDINATFNSTFGSWYLQTDGNVPSTKWDLFSVVLHELGHGLGFMSSFTVQSGRGYWGFGNGTNIFPLVFDTYEMTAATGGTTMINSAANGSAGLRDQLVDGSVFFAGPNAVAAGEGARAKLFAPSPWQGGSSNSPLDETKYDGTANALMTPAIANGEARHVPGPLTVGVMQDIGWHVAGDTPPPPANDDFADAASVGSLPFGDLGVDNTSATAQASETDPTCGAVDGSVWYSYQPSANGKVKFRATPSAGVDTALAVWTGSALDSLSEVACATGAGVGQDESASVDLVGGTTYYIEVGAVDSDHRGQFDFRASVVAPALPPTNDNWESAKASTIGSTSTTTTTDATLQSGEPVPSCSSSMGKSVWFKWTPAANRTIVAQTVGSSFDSVLAVFTGASVNALTQKACNDNRSVDNTSRVKFNVLGGTTYYFQVGGAGGTGATLKFTLKKP